MSNPASKSDSLCTAEQFKEFRSSLQCCRDVYNKWLFVHTLVQKVEQAASEARERAADVHGMCDMKQLRKEGDALLNSLEDARRQELDCLKRYNESEQQLCAARRIVERLFSKIKSSTKEALEQSARCQRTRSALETLKAQALLVRQSQRQISHLRAAVVTMQERAARRRSAQSAQTVVKRAELDELKLTLEILNNEFKSSKQKLSTREADIKELSSETEFLKRSAIQLDEKLKLVKENSEFLSGILKQADAAYECIASCANLSDKNIRSFNELVDRQNSMLEEKGKYIDSLRAFHSNQIDSRRKDLANRLDRLDQVSNEVGRIREAVKFQQIENLSLNAKCVKIGEARGALLLEREMCMAAAEKAKQELTVAEQRSSMDTSNLTKFERELCSSREHEFQLYNSSQMTAVYLNRVELENEEIELEAKAKNEILHNLELQLKDMQIENCSTTRLVMTLKNRLEGLSTESSSLSSAELSNTDAQTERDELETKLREVVAKQKALQQDYKQRKSFKRMLDCQAEVEDLKMQISLSAMTYERIRTSQQNDLMEKRRKLDERIEELLAKKRDFDKENEQLHLRLANVEKEEDNLLQAQRTAATKTNATEAAAHTSIAEARSVFFEEEERNRKKFPGESPGEACARRIQLMYEKGLVPGARRTSRLAGYDAAMQSRTQPNGWPDEEDTGASSRRTGPPLRRGVTPSPSKRKPFKAGVKDLLKIRVICPGRIDNHVAPWMEEQLDAMPHLVEHVRLIKVKRFTVGQQRPLGKGTDNAWPLAIR
ncbi:hypothetical protein M514_05942 [Trichuris suis]|uniref:Uncharacterized protein n=1 Tax=Trichuris suis TaxID=68888 RepID=A0A085N7W0_9BILA|nr:hypothetical protein M514_05942 [Trichuris suis]